MHEILSHTSAPGANSTRNSETIVSVAIQNKKKKIQKIGGLGKRGKEICNTILNTIEHLRSCPRRRVKQIRKLKYLRWILRTMAQTNFKDSKSWMSDDISCIACSTPARSKNKLAQHFKVRNRCTKF